jgi:hypothetical protein
MNALAPQAAHSEYGASSMYRWSKCPGSINACKGIPNRESKYASEGSDAHALLAYCLRNETTPDFYIDKQQMMEGRTFTPDEDMCDAVQIGIDAVNEKYINGGKLLIEQRFDLSDVHPGAFGTADIVIWEDNTQTLYVMDYKHGAGVYVEVENNPQLMYYGLGALMALKVPAKKIVLVVIQPRCGDPANAVREWEMDAIDLIDFRADLKGYINATLDPNAPLIPGKHCGFCLKPPNCEALNNKQQVLARLEFRQDLSYDPDKLALALESVPMMKAWIKAVDEFAYAEAEAGRLIPRHKLVAKIGRRKWKDEEDARSTLLDLCAPEKVMKAPSLKSPAQVEKEIGKGIIDGMTTTESSGHVLVPETDKRLPVKPAAQQEFAAVTIEGTAKVIEAKPQPEKTNAKAKPKIKFK